MYQYMAEVVKVVDGDTIDVFIDLGFKVWHKERIRLNGIDTPEKNTPLGKALKLHMANTLEGKIVKLNVTKPDKYGRYLGEVFLSEGSTSSINEQLYVNKLAKLYGGASKASLWAPEELLRTKIEVVFE